MSISTTLTKHSYEGNNSIVTQYPITFKYFEESHISVYFDGVLQTKGAGADYVMGGDGTTSTGYITTNVAQADTVTVAIVLDVPLDQPVVLQETGLISASTMEDAYDRLNMQIRRVWRKIGDALTFSSDEGGTASTGTADNLIGFDGSGDIAEIPNTTFVQTANNLSDVTAATARTNLGVDAAGTDNSTDVTKTGAGTYVSLAGQVLTVDEITEGDLNASINASLDLADTSIQSLASIEGNSLLSTGATVGQVLQSDGDTTCSFVDLVGGGNAQTANPLSQFAATTSAELAGVISDETGTGALVFATSPALITPDLGTPSAVDLTNATNIPVNSIGTTQIINGSVAKEDLGASVKASLALADTSIQTAGGTVQGTGATTYNIVATDEGTLASTTARGEDSVDLQMSRSAVTQVAGGLASCLIAGQNNEIESGATYSGILAGTGNTVASTAPNAFIMGGYGNTASGARGTVMVGANSTASGDDSLAVGTTTTASHKGAKMFGYGKFSAPFASKADQEFGIQADNFRLAVGTPAVGDVLTCNNVDGSSSWAAPAMSFASYSAPDSGTSSTVVLPLVEDLDPNGIGTVSAGLVTLVAGTYQISHYGEYDEDDGATADLYNIKTRVDGVTEANFVITETDDLGSTNIPWAKCATFIITSASAITVDIYAEETGVAAGLNYQNVKLSVLKLA